MIQFTLLTLQYNTKRNLKLRLNYIKGGGFEFKGGGCEFKGGAVDLKGWLRI